RGGFRRRVCAAGQYLSSCGACADRPRRADLLVQPGTGPSLPRRSGCVGTARGDVGVPAIALSEEPTEVRLPRDEETVAVKGGISCNRSPRVGPRSGSFFWPGNYFA